MSATSLERLPRSQRGPDSWLGWHQTRPSFLYQELPHLRSFAEVSVRVRCCYPRDDLDPVRSIRIPNPVESVWQSVHSRLRPENYFRWLFAGARVLRRDRERLQQQRVAQAYTLAARPPSQATLRRFLP